MSRFGREKIAELPAARKRIGNEFWPAIGAALASREGRGGIDRPEVASQQNETAVKCKRGFPPCCCGQDLHV